MITYRHRYLREALALVRPHQHRDRSRTTIVKERGGWAVTVWLR